MGKYVMAVDRLVIGGTFDSYDEVHAFCQGYRAVRTSNGPELTVYLLEAPPEMYRVVNGRVVATGKGLEGKA